MIILGWGLHGHSPLLGWGLHGHSLLGLVCIVAALLIRAAVSLRVLNCPYTFTVYIVFLLPLLFTFAEESNRVPDCICYIQPEV